MPDALFVKLGRFDGDALVGDEADAIAEALFAELLFEIGTGGLQIKRGARGVGVHRAKWLDREHDDAALVASPQWIKATLRARHQCFRPSWSDTDFRDQRT